MRALVQVLATWLAAANALWAADGPIAFDELTKAQAALEEQQLAKGDRHEQLAALAVFRRTAEPVRYPSGKLSLPGYLYKPAGAGPFPAVIWNHGSEKNPTAQPELARFYTQQRYVFFVPLRRGHGSAAGTYFGNAEDDLRARESRLPVVQQKIVELHELYNEDVVAAVAWLKDQRFVDRERMAMSGASFGGIQTLLTAEKGLSLRAFVPFAPAAMSYANPVLRERLATAVRHAKAPIFVLQAENDYSLGPCRLLGPLLEKMGPPSQAKIYPPFGNTAQQGHGGFACWSLGVKRWGDDVMTFLQATMEPKSEKAE